MSSKRVMIVEHYNATEDLFVDILKSEGYAPICCPGEDLNATCILDAQADLLILELGLGSPSDILLLLRNLRHHPSTSGLPVIVNSTDNQLLERLAEQLRELDCFAVSMPFDLEELLALVGTCLAVGCERGQP